MAHSSIPERIHDVALLYLALAHSTDEYLSDTELKVLTERLSARCPGREPAEVQDAIMDALATYMESEDEVAAFTQAMTSLRQALSPEDRAVVLEDLIHVARADGVVLENEHGLLASLAATWGVALPGEQLPAGTPSEDAGEAWGILHHLAFVYLVLAHGTDNDLSAPEVRVIQTRLREWQPDVAEADLRAVFDAAKRRYARTPDEAVLVASIEAIRQSLPRQQRMAALTDLIQIANADGIFLDDEEDLINRLMNAWELAAYTNYGEHGNKE